LIWEKATVKANAQTRRRCHRLLMKGLKMQRILSVYDT
jgi:hypothetical protein